jgi:hypothetical protein
LSSEPGARHPSTHHAAVTESRPSTILLPVERDT